MQLAVSLDGGTDGGPKYKSVQRGASVNIGDSTSVLLDAIDQFPLDFKNSVIKTANTSRGSNASSRLGYFGYSGIDECFEEKSVKRHMLNKNSNQYQARGKLTLPHLENCQTKSLDIPNSQSESPNLLHAKSDISVDNVRIQSKSLDISPVDTRGITKPQKPCMPMPPISIHIRKPTVKSSVHGK